MRCKHYHINSEATLQVFVSVCPSEALESILCDVIKIRLKRRDAM